jgi:hypothetical protein
MKQGSAWIARLLGLGALVLGAWVLSVSWPQLAHLPGGAQSDYVRVSAEVVGLQASANWEDRFATIYRFELPDGPVRECDDNLYSANPPDVGERETLAVRRSVEPGQCGILVNAPSKLGAYFLIGIGLAFALMGLAFVIRPPKTVNFGEGGDGGATGV